MQIRVLIFVLMSLNALASEKRCEGPLEVSVKIHAVSSPAPIWNSFQISFHPNEKKNIYGNAEFFSDKGSLSKRKLNKLQCIAWQNSLLPKLHKAIQNHRAPARKKMECIYVASIHVKASGKVQKEKLCINAASKDQVSEDFRFFYEGTEVAFK